MALLSWILCRPHVILHWAPTENGYETGVLKNFRLSQLQIIAKQGITKPQLVGYKYMSSEELLSSGARTMGLFEATCYCCTILIVIAVLQLTPASSATNTSCPTWKFYNNATRQCKCGYGLRCHKDQVMIQDNYCATSSGEGGQYFLAYCPFGHPVNRTNRMLAEMPTDPDMLDDVMCGPYKRKGLLCGECIEGYGPAVYSFDMKCADCSIMSPGYAVTLYLLLELCPITVLFIVLIVFRLNITSGPLLGYLVFCQNFSLWQQNKFYYFKSHASTSFRLMFKLTLTLFQLWSFQFLQSVIPPFCISEKLTGVQIQMLSLVSATYPVIPVIVTCSFMELRTCKELQNPSHSLEAIQNHPQQHQLHWSDQ